MRELRVGERERDGGGRETERDRERERERDRERQRCRGTDRRIEAGMEADRSETVTSVPFGVTRVHTQLAYLIISVF